MKNTTKIIRITFLSLSCLTLLILFIVILCNFKSLTQEIGIHFNGHGQYDLKGPKSNLLSYYPIGIITIVVFEVFQQFAMFLQIKDNISEDGKRLMRLIATSFIGLIELDISVFILMMGYCIATQSLLNTSLTAGCALVLLLSIVLVAIATVWITRKYATPNHKQFTSDERVV